MQTGIGLTRLMGCRIAALPISGTCGSVPTPCSVQKIVVRIDCDVQSLLSDLDLTHDEIIFCTIALKGVPKERYKSTYGVKQLKNGVRVSSSPIPAYCYAHLI